MQDIILIIPEITMALFSMALLIYGVYVKTDQIFMKRATLFTLLVSLLLLYLLSDYQGLAFADSFIQDSLSFFMKSVLLLAACFVMLLSYSFYADKNELGYEFSIIALFSIIGMMVMISANSLILVYLGLELQSLSLYILVTFSKERARSAEAGLKYFVLGALSSGLLLYGMSLIYGSTGSVIFGPISQVLSSGAADDNLMVKFGIVFILAGIAFKISAVPFHMWTPDVYEGSSTPVTAFLSTLPKFAAMVMLLRLVHSAFGDLASLWLQLIAFLCIFSMILAAIAAIGQLNIKRLMAYSSIGHVGYMLIGVAASAVNPHFGTQAVLIYLIIYLVMSVGSFAVILSMRNQDGTMERISDLAGYSRIDAKMAAFFAIMLFSFAGVPPLAGFFGKYFVFLAAIEAGMYLIAIIGILSSVIAAYYYLHIIKVMYFDEAQHQYEEASRENLIIGFIASVLVASFFFYPALLAGFVERSLATFF